MAMKFINDPKGLVPEELEEDNVHDDDAEYNRSESKEMEKDKIPTGSVEVASFSVEIDRPDIEWLIDRTFFVIPSKFKDIFALMILNWDDNWEKWDWEFEVAVSGANSIEEASVFLMKNYAKQRLEDSNEEFSDFLRRFI